jgi:hypothetical protein
MERGNLSIEVSSLNEEESGSLGAAFDCGPQSAGASAACAAELSAAAARGSGPAANAAAGRPFAAACNDDAATPPGAPRTEFMLPAAGPLALV